MKLNPTCCQHGPQDTPGAPKSPKTPPQSLQLGAKMVPRHGLPLTRVLRKGSWISKTCKSRGRSFKNGSWARLGRFLEPTWPPDLPTWRQDDSQTSDLGPRWLPDPSTWTQDGLQAPQLGAIKVSNSRGKSSKTSKSHGMSFKNGY